MKKVDNNKLFYFLGLYVKITLLVLLGTVVGVLVGTGNFHGTSIYIDGVILSSHGFSILLVGLYFGCLVFAANFGFKLGMSIEEKIFSDKKQQPPAEHKEPFLKLEQ